MDMCTSYVWSSVFIITITDLTTVRNLEIIPDTYKVVEICSYESYA